jgi:CHASE2 domain-containing sensor protein
MKWLSSLGRRFTSARALCVALLFALMFLRITDPIPLEELRLRAFDIFQVIKPRDATSRPVVIVDIDEQSLQKLGQFPWPRTRIADMITRLTRLGAAAIAFDVVFSEPDRLSPALAADVYRDLDDETRNKLRALPSNDQIMADAMRPSRVVLGQTGLPTVQPEPDVQLPSAGVAALGGDPKRFVYEFPGLLRNIPSLENAAAGRGVFSIRTERDGIVRRVPMVVQAQGNVLPSLSFETLRVATGASTILVRMDTAGITGVALPGFEMPTDRNGQLWIHFAPHDQERFVSALDLLEGRVAADRVSRRLVLIGTSAAGLLDLKSTPNDPVMPGVEVHAQVLESILSNSMLSAPSYAVITELGAAFVLGVAIIALAPILSTHELNACEAALDMLERVDRLNGEREAAAKANGSLFIPINIGVGINTGRCVVGNMGSDLRFDYSVLGDSVNLASRLEGQCKSYGLPIIIGSRTANAAKDKFALLELDFIAVKGKKEPEVVYSIVGRNDLANSGRFQRWRELNMNMLSRYRSRDWTGALAAIEEGMAADEENRFKTLYNIYSERIRMFQITPPPNDWDGAYALDSK